MEVIYYLVIQVWLSGLLLFELTNPSDKSGLGWVKLAVLLLSVVGVAFHLVGFCGLVPGSYLPTMMYLRNQMFATSFLMACVQILDFLSFHHLFGPWAIIIGDLMKDLARFLVVLSIFVFGFSMQFVSMNHPINRKLDKKPAESFSEGKRRAKHVSPVGPYLEGDFIKLCALLMLFQIYEY